MDDLDPIAVLMDEMKDEDLQIRVNAIKRLSTIALALGEDRTRKDLVPYLCNCMEEEDELLLALSEELGKFGLLVGGPQHSHVLLKPLQTLAQVEETLVREKAVESLRTVTKDHTAEQLKNHFLPVVRALAAGEWFASRASASSLFDCVYGRVAPDVQAELRALFQQLCHDDTPMVRRAAAQNLGKLALLASAEHIKSDYLPMLTFLLQDDQDTVRLLAVGDILPFARMLPQEDAAQLLIPHLHTASKDRSWRVRFVVAEKWTELQSSLGPNVTKVDLVPILGRLLGDQEAEVRTQASFRISDVAVNLPLPDRQVVISTNILPRLAELCVDGSPHVRVAVASAFINTASVLGSEKTLESLVPLYIKLLKDDSPEVRLSVITRLETLQSVIGIDNICATIIPEIVFLAEDQQWRVRLALIEQIPALAHNFPVDQFDQKLTGLTLSWLGDSIYAVREAAAFILKSLIEIYGVAWAKKSIIPKIVALGADKTYLSRLTTLLVITTISEVVQRDIATKDLLPIAIALTKDGVPNVRFNAARTLERLIPLLDKSVVTKEIVPALEPLKQDKDIDVQFFSKKALSVC
eukprot:m.76559 g.76559  ORF g.76559 m.76559 type:complete len:581 (+) comp14642_c0_seq1:206-1948(+)